MAHCWRCDREGGSGSACQHCGGILLGGEGSSLGTADTGPSSLRVVAVVAVLIAVIVGVLAARLGRPSSETAVTPSTPTTARPDRLPLSEPHAGYLVVNNDMIDLSTGARRPAPVPGLLGTRLRVVA